MASLRVADVASSLGVSSGLVFYHFDTKDALLVAALEFAVERDLARLDKALAKGSTPTEQLARILASYGPTGAAPGWTIWIDAFATALREPTHPPLAADDGQALVHAPCSRRSRPASDSGDFTCADPAASRGAHRRAARRTDDRGARLRHRHPQLSSRRGYARRPPTRSACRRPTFA